MVGGKRLDPERFVAARGKKTEGQANALASRLRGILKDEHGRILDVFGAKAIATDPRYDTDRLVRLMPLLALLPGITAETERKLAEEIEKYANQTVGRVNALLDGAVTQAQIVAISEAIRDHALRAAVYLNLSDGSRNALAILFDRAARGELDYAGLRAELRSAFDAAASRAEVVARTEITYASEAVSREGYRLLGIERMQWVFGGGPCTTGVCAELDGQIIGLNEGVRGVGGGFGTIEGPPAHPNCTCFTIPVLEGESLAP